MGSVAVRHVEASHCVEAGYHGVDGVVFECCGDRGRDRSCGVACIGGLGHNECLPHCPLGPCRGGVCDVVE